MSTPMRRQYLDLKSQHPDTLLLFRMGDFYETFDDDAHILAEVCGIALTSRPVGKNQRVPLAGVPHHALESHLGKLIGRGYRVAIAEQVSDPGQGLVDREITQVMTRGTVTEPNLLTPQRNLLLAVHLEVQECGAGLAYCDLAEGILATCQLQASSLRALTDAVTDELTRLEPSEILTSPLLAQQSPELVRALDRLDSATSELEPWLWEYRASRQRMQEHFRVRSLDGFGLADKPLAVGAVGALLHYIQQFQPLVASHLDRVATYSRSDFMVLDEFTRLNLELTENLRTRTAEGSLLAVLDRTLTPMGARLLREWLGQPLLNVADIAARLEAVNQLHADGLELRRIRDALKPMGDLARWVQRVRYGTASPRDLVGIRETLARIPQLADPETQIAEGPITALLRGLPQCTDTWALLDRALVADPPASLSLGGLIREGYDRALDALVREAHNAKESLARMEQTERQRLNLPSVKVGFNKVFGYYIEVPRSQSHRVPADYVRKQTLVNAERYFTEELKRCESLILTSDQKQLELEQTLYRDIREQVRARQSELQILAERLALLDVYSSLALVAVENRYVRPEVSDSFDLFIQQGRHPVVEHTLSETTFVPNDCTMTREQTVQILTGPNMAGKSTYLRQIALTVLMAQMGSFVPARAARIGVVDRIFTRIGANDAIQRGLSTFMVEMIETANILNHASPRSLLILDEIGRGTSTYDGLAIAWAILEYVHNAGHLGAKTLFATHFHELTDLAERLPRIRNLHVAIDDSGEDIAFLHTIAEGRAQRSFGVHVGRMAGLPQAVVDRADQILGQLEASGAAVPDSLADLVPEPQGAVQPVLFLEEHPAVSALRRMDMDSMTPLEAINQLYALVKLTRE